MDGSNITTPSIEVLPVKSAFSLLNTQALLIGGDKIQTTPLRLDESYPLVKNYLEYTQLESHNDSALTFELLRIEQLVFNIKQGKENSLFAVKHQGIVVTETDISYELSVTVTVEDDEPHEFTFTINKRKLWQFGELSLNVEVGDLETPKYTISPVAYVAVIQFKEVS